MTWPVCSVFESWAEDNDDNDDGNFTGTLLGQLVTLNLRDDKGGLSSSLR